MSAQLAVIFGDGVGPEILEASFFILREAGAQLEIETIEAGSRLYNIDAPFGLFPGTWDTLKRTRLLLKAPTIMPQNASFTPVSTAIREKMLSEEFQERSRYAFIKTSPLQLMWSQTPIDDAHRVAAATAYTSEAFSLFEPLQEIETDAAGQNTANPSSMLLAATMMLSHIGQDQTALLIENAWLRTLEDGVHTADLPLPGEPVGTGDFAHAVVARLGRKPNALISAA